jgi:Sulfotransferase family
VISRGQLRQRLRDLRPRRPAPFIVGVTRSGTTLLRLMLDSHPKLTIPPETHFLPKLIRLADKPDAKPAKVARRISNHRRWGDFEIPRKEFAHALRERRELSGTEAVRAFYELYARKQGKPRWGDKTPGYQIRMLKLRKALPEARFIHVIRDGRDVVLSQARKASEPTPLDTAAKRWRSRVLATRLRARRLDESSYLEIRYEDLIRDTEGTLRRICEFVDLRFDRRMLAYHERAGERLQEIAKELPAAEGRGELDADARISAHELAHEPPRQERVEAWRAEMSPEDVARFERAAGDLLAELGYELVSGEAFEEEADDAEGAGQPERQRAG